MIGSRDSNKTGADLLLPMFVPNRVDNVVIVVVTRRITYQREVEEHQGEASRIHLSWQ